MAIINGTQLNDNNTVQFDGINFTPIASLYGTTGNDFIYGYGGDDFLFGDLGNDTLDGGTGIDIMYGGDGNDTFYVDNVGDLVYEGTDVSGGIDEVISSINYTLGAGVEALQLTGNAQTGYGNAGANVLLGNTVLSNLYGLNGDDQLFGAAGSDNLDGGSGADFMSGGGGADTYYVDNVGDTVSEQNTFAGGNDAVYTSISYTLAYGVEGLNLEGNSNINGTGNDKANHIAGNSGNNILMGGGGNDTIDGGFYSDDILDGGTGADTMIGGWGNDTYMVDNSNDLCSNIIGNDQHTNYASIVLSTVSYGLSSSGISLANLTLLGTAAIDATGNGVDNNLIGNIGNNTLFGLEGNDHLDGGAGNDYLNGGAGNDYLDGGLGVDIMDGGLGNDLYSVDSSNDSVAEDTIASAGMDTVSATVSYTLSQNIENLALLGDALNGSGNGDNNTLIGNDRNNVFYGLAGNDHLEGGLGDDGLYGDDGDDKLNGGAGNDYLDGGAGADILDGSDGDDVYVVDNIGDIIAESSGVDTVNATISYTLQVDLENLNLLGGDNVNATGDNGDNTIYGNTGNNTLNGLGGNDYMVGNAGDDLLFGGDGNDYLHSGDGNDILDGGAGADTMDGSDQDDLYFVDNIGDVVSEQYNDALGGIDTVNASVSFALGFGIENLYLTGFDSINGVGNENNNIVYGNWGDNKLNGGLGDDVINGAAGNDLLNGDTGADSLFGGIGNDTYVVDNIGDNVNEANGGGTDIVMSSVNFTLGGFTENLSLTGVAVVNGTGNSLNNLLKGNNKANALSGLDGNDNFNGNGGNDTVDGGIGKDTLNGGLGNDSLTGGLGIDKFFFNTVLGASNKDTLTDFSVADDTIVLENAIFKSFAATGSIAAGNFVNGTGAADANDYLVYNTANGALSYDADGSGAGAAVQFATLVGIPALTSADFLIV